MIVTARDRPFLRCRSACDARVASEEARLLERRAVVLAVDLVERTGDRETERTGLARGTAAGDLRDHVVAAEQFEDLERVVDELLVELVREVLLERASVDRERAAAGDEAHAGDRLLAATDGRAGNVEGCAHGGRSRLGRGLGAVALGELRGQGIFDLRHGVVNP